MEEHSIRHFNIPIFIPQIACPHQCIYCNQHYISGQQSAPTIDEVKNIIDSYLHSMYNISTSERNESITPNVQVAFFGGTFTALSMEMQENYLKAVQPYIQSDMVQSIRLSTRPDYINKENLDLLKQYNIQDIELGAQSLDDEVLAFSERGHTKKDVQKASKLILSYGFNLGLQMMIGLPLDTKIKSLETARQIIDLGASSTRIYPTLVVAKTPLERFYRQGKYTPLTIAEAVDWTKDIYSLFLKNNVKVLRVGLHPSRDLRSGRGYVACPFHVSFKELVLSKIWAEKLATIPSYARFIGVNPLDINYVIGYSGCNRSLFLRFHKGFKVIQNKGVNEGNFVFA